MYDVMFEYMSDEEKRAQSCGEVSDDVSFTRNGYKPTDKGLFSERIFGTKKGASCKCGAFNIEGLECPLCLTKVKGQGQKNRWGHIELAAPFYGVYSYLLAQIYGITEMNFINCYCGIPTKINGQTISGPYALSKLSVDLDAVRKGISARIEELETNQMSTNPHKKEMNYGEIPKLEDTLEAITVMQAIGMSVQDLYSNVILVPPIAKRPFAEVGADPLGVKNSAYLSILQANNELKEISEKVKASKENIIKEDFRDAYRKYAQTMITAFSALNEFVVDKASNENAKSIGERNEKLRIPNSIFGTALVDKNLRIDEIGMSYNMLVSIYQKEILNELMSSYRDKMQKFKPMDELSDIEKEERLAFYKEKDKAEKEFKNKIKSQIHEGYSDDIADIINKIIKDEVLFCLRYPCVSKDSFVALRPVMLDSAHTIAVNPNICDKMALDFDGDQLHVYRYNRKDKWIIWNKFGPQYSPYSSKTGEAVYTNDREDAMGVYLATKIDRPEDSFFKRDVIVTNILGDIKNNKVVSQEAFVYARHILWKQEEGFQVAKEFSDFGAVQAGDVIGAKDGKEIKSEFDGFIQKIDDKYIILSPSKDFLCFPKDAKINVKKNDLVPVNTMVGTWQPKEFSSLDSAYEKGEINLTGLVKLRVSPTESIETCYGAWHLANLLTDTELDKVKAEAEASQSLMVGKSKTSIIKQLDKTKGRYTERFKALLSGFITKEMLQKECSKLYELYGPERTTEMLNPILEFGEEVASSRAVYNNYDIFKYENKTLDASMYRNNSIADQINSGAKGSVKGVAQAKYYVKGLHSIIDIELKRSLSAMLDKAGEKDASGMQPMQEIGKVQRLVSSQAYNMAITEDDCGTSFFEDTTEASRINGRTLAEDISIPDKNVYLSKGDLVNEETSQILSQYAIANNRAIKIRTIGGCQCAQGVCAKCYGRSVTEMTVPEKNTRVGIEGTMALTGATSESGSVLKASANQGKNDASLPSQIENCLTLEDGTFENYPYNYAKSGAEAVIVAYENVFKKLTEIVAGSDFSITPKHLEVLARIAVSDVKIKEKGKEPVVMTYGQFLKWYSENKEALCLDDPQKSKATVILRKNSYGYTNDSSIGGRDNVRKMAVESVKALGEEA